MPRRPANVTQADIARAIRAMKATGLPVVRVTVRADGGVSVETTTESEAGPALPDEAIAEPERIVAL